MTPDPKRRYGPITIEFDSTADDAVSAALTMLAYALSGLPPDKREAKLGELEDGTLRATARRFVAARIARPYHWPKTQTCRQRTPENAA